MFRRTVFYCRVLFVILSVFLTGVFAPQLTRAEGFSAEEARKLLIRTDENSEPPQYEGFVLMRNNQPNREIQENKVRMLRKDDKMLVIFVEPPSQKGQVFIRDADDMWMYLPRSKKVMRIGAKDASMGGEASNADVMRTALADDYDPIYLGEEVMEGVVCHKLQLTAKRRTVAYDKVIYWISEEKEIPVRREYYALSGKKLRTMYFHEAKVLGGLERPTRIVIENAERNEYWTEMVFTELNPDVKWEDYIFTPAYVRQGLVF